MVGNFLKLKCEKCNNEQNVFSKASIEVKCLVCGEVLAKPNGGMAELGKCEILDKMTY
ncbi:MAG: 30S ribosomal protein S27e [Candidatus Aenigmarchaeota archaeon]|nr:30S ribosomal protein S27e [Candidatus Aenigmarchaeota archaeon]MCK5321794.1 30S ribosomal protein S27e [Candidatus Aenigmarchaeota archaeon]